MANSRAVTGIDNSGSFRVYMGISTDIVKEAKKLHQTSPLATHLLGRALTGTGLMGLMLREPGMKITMQFKGDGPAEQVLCTADSTGHVKGYIVHPLVEMPAREDGSLDVSGALGNGTLTCIRDMVGSKDPYVGKVPLYSGEIAEDIASYLYQSEQVKTVVSLGVKLDENGEVEAAGGIIVQLLPDASEEAVKALEEWLPKMPKISELTKAVEGDGSRDDQTVLTEFLERAFLGMPDEFSVRPLDFHDFEWKCGCSVGRFEQGIISLGVKEIHQIIEEDGQAEIVCQFCGKKYNFDKEHLERLELIAAAKNIK
ncbi:MAG: Hsp33 family molecular chaperone HslO [Anaerovoracaceae bacterium]|nr:Hsp33 family molecular chaperone HslO [Bacillota bacterium]MDY2670812.1 Hsp33 family molecular chaperone HslO [Anaerovoracaceae bacterium]